MPHYNSVTTLSRILLFLSLSVVCFSLTTSSDVKSYHLHHVIRDSKNEYTRPILPGSGRTISVPVPVLVEDEDGYSGRSRWNLEEQATNSSMMLLAAEATTRKDPTNDFKLYTGGWNIADEHYWASVGFTAVPFFTLSVVWFIVFGILLCCMGICCCCCRKDTKDYSSATYTISLVFLVLFLLAAIGGSILLYLGEGNLGKSTAGTFHYIINQVDTTAQKLMSLSNYLVAAKDIDVDSVILPAEVRKTIDNLETNINATSYMLGSQTLKNSIRIERVLGQTGVSMDLVSALMLALAFLGLWFSVLGCECIVYMLVIIGWLLVTSTYLTCGIFLLFHNAIADTCIAMNEWVQHPAARTAMDQITPCVDKATAEDTLSHTRDVTYQLVHMVNGVITNISNANNVPSAAGPPLYFNQSGPPVPLLCNPLNPDLSDRKCASGEVNLTEASTVWKQYTCEVSSNELCMTQGRLTPNLYAQNVAAANVSFGLYHYGSFLVSLGDCTFIRQTISDVTTNHCPGLMRYSQWVYIGMVLLGDAVMMSVILWITLARQVKRRIASRSNQF